MTYLEWQSKLDNYETPLEDYMEMVIDYGYVVMFAVAFPLAPLIAFVMVVIEVRIDAYKLCYLTRRPFPIPAQDIGVWYPII